MAVFERGKVWWNATREIRFPAQIVSIGDNTVWKELDVILHRRIVGTSIRVAASLVLLPPFFGCRQSPPTVKAGEDRQPTPLAQGDVPTLPPKSLNRRPDGSLEITGHWTLKVSEVPAGQAPFGAQRLNSTIIRCWPLNRMCEEYRAQVSYGILFPLEPLRFSVVSWDAGKILATQDIGSDIRVLFQIDLGSEQVEMEYRREPSPGRGRVFERWVLE